MVTKAKTRPKVSTAWASVSSKRAVKTRLRQANKRKRRRRPNIRDDIKILKQMFADQYNVLSHILDDLTSIRDVFGIMRIMPMRVSTNDMPQNGNESPAEPGSGPEVIDDDDIQNVF